MFRRTKIVATLGPATDRPGVLEEAFKAGLDVVRLNFSHGMADDHRKRAQAVRELSDRYNRHVGVLADLQGPKIRVARFRSGKVDLKVGQRFVLDIGLAADAGDETQVGCLYEALPNDVEAGNRLVLDDGRVVMDVESVEGGKVICTVVIGGVLSDYKGINLQGGGLSAAALTDKDREDIKTAVEIEADYIAVSFPRSADDIEEARSLMKAAGGHAGIVAKIERAEALTVIDDIIKASEVIMVARGDLGVEIGDANLPPVQKHLIKRARELDTVVITATQMMESMIYNPMPTRAEVFDVANAVVDGTDAVMLSAETAAGKYPVEAIAAMGRICKEAEKQPSVRRSDHRVNERFEQVDEAVAMSAVYLANHAEIKAIAALTESGSTPLWMSRISSGIPILAMTNRLKTSRKVTLYRGVYPLSFEPGTADHVQANKAVIDELLKRNVVENGDLVIITKGDLIGRAGGTNALKVVRVGEGLLA